MKSKSLAQLNEDLAMHVSYISITINILLSAFKLVAGIIGHSAAMVSDAIHSASDVFSTFIVIIGIRLSNKASDSTHQYGHEKLEYIAAMVLAFVLLVTGIGIGYEGMQNIFSDNYEHLQAPTYIALVAAVISIVVKEAMFWYTKGAAVKINSGALMADAWHHRSDALSSIGSLIGIGGAMMGYPIMDSLASVVICIMIIYAAWKIFIDATNKLVDHACDEETLEAMRKHVLSQDGVHGIDEIRTRMFGSKYYVDIDISADGNQSLFHAHHIAEKVHDTIEHNFPNVKHCMVHVSPSKRDDQPKT
ncbi:MAG: cation diffusion facilitator family transporter [Acidaminococcaceae bacterium]|nr:cation diffusion facilitator family transporter [Acidaminococcaceae bacterium]MDD4722912.1 cation diffusion facilitator family transporter [Acidaminococcaceae bacterium]